MFKKFLQIFCKTIDTIVMWLGKGTSLLMPVLAFIVAFEVVARYVFDAPTIWAYDLSLFLFGYIAALGGAYAQQKNLILMLIFFIYQFRLKLKISLI